MRRKLLVGILLAGALLLAACGGGPSVEGIAVQDPWVRPAPMEGGNGAAYMVIANGGDTDDALLGVSADFAERVEVHETFTAEAEESGEGMDMEGGEMMGMRPVESITVPAGGSVTLEPGGYHVMLMGVGQVFEEGDTVTLTLTFEDAGQVTVEAPVRRE